MIKSVGLVGVGKMGLRMALRLIEKGYNIIVMDVISEAVKTAEKHGAIRADSVTQLTKHLPKPRIIILSLPTGETVSRVINNLIPFLSRGDIIIDSGNSFYKDSQLRAKKLKQIGIHFLDVGISGGVEGARNGACLMIGGDKKIFKRVEHLFYDLSKNGTYLYLGKSGSGHLTKGFHNLIEYGYLQALSEGIYSLQTISKKEKLNLNIKDVCKIWGKGSIIESKLINCLKRALENNPELKGIEGSVLGQSQKEMENLVLLVKHYGIQVPSCKTAIDMRKKSKKNPTPQGSIINAIRNVFGGHKEWEKQ